MNNPEHGEQKPQDIERFWSGFDPVSHGRARIVLISVICAGIVSLLIGRVIEVQGLNKQRSRTIANCQRVQDDRRSLAESFGAQADNILGNPKKHIPPFEFKGTPFETFKPLIVAQAISNRKISIAYMSRIENCGKVFPTIHIFDI